MKLKRIKDWSPVILPVILLLLIISMSAEIVQPVNNPMVKPSQWAQSSAVLLNNSKEIIPLGDLESRTIASVSIGSVYAPQFDSILTKYAHVIPFTLENSKSPGAIDTLNAGLKLFNTVILAVTDTTISDAGVQRFIDGINKIKQLIVVVYGNQRGLQFLDQVDCPVIWVSQNTPALAMHMAQAIFGGVAITAKLPENVSPHFTKGSGYVTSVSRLTYTTPEEAGINGKAIENSIDKIVTEAIVQQATPGAVVMVVKDGKVIFNKAYGSHTYQKDIPEKVGDIFDLASVTKIGATTMAAMRLYEQKKLNLDSTVGAYIPLAGNTNKNTIQVKELLLHQAGFIPFIPFYRELKPGDYSRDSSSVYTVKVADHYYLRSNYFENVMWPQMLNSPLVSRGKYVYSDLSMYFMKDIIERLTAQPLDKYVETEFYSPLGMYTAGFNPRKRFDKIQIVPTEQDEIFRKVLLEGYVHDQGAAMAGGVAGHAGLFSTANDMAILFQMILNGGKYGGKQYFKPETIQRFTAKYSNVSRRGLGFDRWDPDRTNRYPSDLASSKTYGHTGYTGTCVWVDPEYNLIYIFLSNRVHPQVSGKLSSLRIRPRIQDVIYGAIKSDKSEHK